MSAAAAPATPPTAPDPNAPLLQIEGLTVCHRTLASGDVPLVQDVSLHVSRGEALGLAGESGCGKTTTALAVLGLLPEGVVRTAGSITVNSSRGVMNVHRRTERGLQDLRWNTVSMIFQGAMNALDPCMRVSDQIAEAIRRHDTVPSGEPVNQRIRELFGYVGISPTRARQYPHEFSGGMRQRVMIALALACRPELVIADEPTTALDVMMQAQILELLEDLRRDLGLALLLITHDLSVLAETCDRIAVMYAGEIAEEGPVREVFTTPQHPYTQRLLGAYPAVGGPRTLAPPIPGVPPDPARQPPGCRFEPRCHRKDPERCSTEHPDVRDVGPGRVARCLFAPWPDTSPEAVE